MKDRNKPGLKNSMGKHLTFRSLKGTYAKLHDAEHNTALVVNNLSNPVGPARNQGGVPRASALAAFQKLLRAAPAPLF